MIKLLLSFRMSFVLVLAKVVKIAFEIPHSFRFAAHQFQVLNTTVFQKCARYFSFFFTWFYVSVSKGFEESTGRGALKVTDAWYQIWTTSKRISKARELKCSKDRISVKVCSKICFVEQRFDAICSSMLNALFNFLSCSSEIIRDSM